MIYSAPGALDAIGSLMNFDMYAFMESVIVCCSVLGAIHGTSLISCYMGKASSLGYSSKPCLTDGIRGM